MKKVPSIVSINLKTGEEMTKYVEITDEQYEERLIKPLARILYEQMKRDIETGKFYPTTMPK